MPEGELSFTDAAVSIAASGTPGLVPLAACLGIFRSQSLQVQQQRPHACRERGRECQMVCKLVKPQLVSPVQDLQTCLLSRFSLQAKKLSQPW